MNIFKRMENADDKILMLEKKIANLSDMVRRYTSEVKRIEIESKQSNCKHENIEFIVNRTPILGGMAIVCDEQFYSTCADCGLIIEEFKNRDELMNKAGRN